MFSNFEKKPKSWINEITSNIIKMYLDTKYKYTDMSIDIS